MEPMGDLELLRDYAHHHSEKAFAELVGRYVNLVYSTALRHLPGPQHAEEVTQAVFLLLARKAGSLGADTILSAWLYQAARLTAANAVRAEHRRQRRDHEAYMQSQSPSANTDWLQIAPLLDEAMATLGDQDRAAIILRFMEGKSFHDAGRALGASEDAAKMRVNRALEKLRAFFTRRGVTISLAAAGSAISAHAVHAAPAGLAATVVSATLGATAVSTFTVTKGALNLMAWTKTNLAIGACVTAVVATQWHQIGTQRDQIAALQKQQVALHAQLSDAPRAATETREVRQLRADTASLKAELHQLREQMSTPPAITVGTAFGTPVTAPASPVAAVEQAISQAVETPTPEAAQMETARQLGMAAAQGDRAALKKLQDYSLAAGRDFSTNSAGLRDWEKGDRQRQLFSPLWVAFDVITEEARKGSSTAMQAISNAAETPGLQGVAIKSIGALAGSGNESALEILLNPDKYHLLPTSVVGALKPAAESGDLRAINALAAVTADPKKQPLWFMVANGLKKPAESGNELAIDTLIYLAGQTNISVHREAVSGLKAAALKNHAKAAAAVQLISVR
jgi:RNA polymerase sigma factor (sigma-70 family)